jgi:hypothetical protein
VAIASISSMKIMDGAFSRAILNTSLLIHDSMVFFHTKLKSWAPASEEDANNKKFTEVKITCC